MAITLATWTIDPVHSSVEFSLDYMGLSIYRTGFRALEGSLQFDAARPAASSVNASIPVASVDVTNDRLMSRLMDPDLLGGRDHPTVTFRSTRVEALDPAQRAPRTSASACRSRSPSWPLARTDRGDQSMKGL